MKKLLLCLFVSFLSVITFQSCSDKEDSEPDIELNSSMLSGNNVGSFKLSVEGVDYKITFVEDLGYIIVSRSEPILFESLYYTFRGNKVILSHEESGLPEEFTVQKIFKDDSGKTHIKIKDSTYENILNDEYVSSR